MNARRIALLLLCAVLAVTCSAYGADSSQKNAENPVIAGSEGFAHKSSQTNVEDSKKRDGTPIIPMDWITILILSGGAVCLLIFVYAAWALYVAKNAVFQGSGSPIPMAQALISSVQILAQYLIAILIVITIAILITMGTVQSQAGVPIISAVAGYVLGKSTKSFSVRPKN